MAIASGSLTDLTNSLAGSITGKVLTPDSPGYEEARRVRNGLIDRRPAVIVQCAGTADVVVSVNLAREYGLVVSIRGGGHGVSGMATNDGGMVIDLSAMRSVEVDPATRRAFAQGGATWADLDAASQAHGLATPGGVVSSTGIGGLTLHGGLGHLRRKYGLSLDNVRSVEIVTADGQILLASEAVHPDLFWAVLGAGSNFGVVTRFEFELYPVGPEIALCGVIYPITAAREVLRAWRDFGESAPDDVSMIALLWGIPDHEAFPEELRTMPVAVLAAVYAGDAEEGMRLFEPLRRIAEPVLDLSEIEPYTHLQSGFDPFFPVGRLYYWKSMYLDSMSDDVIDIMIEWAGKRPSPMTSITLWQLGGAIARGDRAHTSFGRRDAPYLVTGESTWTDPGQNDANVAWSRDFLDALRPYSQGGLYINFPGFAEHREAMLRDAFGDNVDRLLTLKQRYDPTNLFSMNLNLRTTT